MPNIVAVIPTTAGREDNLKLVIAALENQTVPIHYLIVEDGGLAEHHCGPRGVAVATSQKHQPGMEQPRNVGVRHASHVWPDATHVWFVDSDILFNPDAHALIHGALAMGPEDRILAGPYDWMNPDIRHWLPRNHPEQSRDMRYPMMDAAPPDKVHFNDLSAGLGCFGGNLVWPISEFQRVGGFWNELYMGRCEDGELGARAVAMGVGISFMVKVRGCHLWHPVDYAAAEAKNTRDVPMLDARHPWIQGNGVFLVDRDGKAFDTLCPACGQQVHTIRWWEHAAACGIAPEIPVS